MTTAAAPRFPALRIVPAREDRTTPVTAVRHRRHDRNAQVPIRPRASRRALPPRQPAVRLCLRASTPLRDRLVLATADVYRVCCESPGATIQVSGDRWYESIDQ